MKGVRRKVFVELTDRAGALSDEMYESLVTRRSEAMERYSLRELEVILDFLQRRAKTLEEYADLLK